MAGAALIATTAGTALGQEESPSPEVSMAPEVTVVEPSTLEIIDVASHKTAWQPLKGKKLKKAVAKAAPTAARYVINDSGDDAAERIIELSLAARAADEAGDSKLAAALVGVAKLLYRNEWTRTKSGPLALNQVLEDAIVAAHPQGHPALVLSALPYDDLMDICLTKTGSWLYNPQTPSLCADDGAGRMARVDYSLVDESKNGQPGLFTGDFEQADVGGVGIHKVVQDKTANDKLPGKKFKKAWSKALSKHGPTVAGYGPGERGVVEMVLAARAADEAGNKEAAKAFMALALAAYRAGVLEPQVTSEYNDSIVSLIDEEYAGRPGLELYPPEGMVDACTVQGTNFPPCISPGQEPWVCHGIPNVYLERITMEEGESIGCEF